MCSKTKVKYKYANQEQKCIIEVDASMICKIRGEIGVVFFNLILAPSLQGVPPRPSIHAVKLPSLIFQLDVFLLTAHFVQIYFALQTHRQ